MVTTLLKLQRVDAVGAPEKQAQSLRLLDLLSLTMLQTVTEHITKWTVFAACVSINSSEAGSQKQCSVVMGVHVYSTRVSVDISSIHFLQIPVYLEFP